MYFITDLKSNRSTLTVENLLLQEEYLTTAALSVFKVTYFVRSGPSLVDSRMDVGISASAVESSLQAVTVTSTGSTYDEFLFTGDVSALFNLRYMVGLPLVQAVAPGVYTEFQNVLKYAWSELSDGEKKRYQFIVNAIIYQFLQVVTFLFSSFRICKSFSMHANIYVVPEFKNVEVEVIALEEYLDDSGYEATNFKLLYLNVFLFKRN